MTAKELNNVDKYYESMKDIRYRSSTFHNKETGEVIFVVYESNHSTFITLKDLVSFNKDILRGVVLWFKTRSVSEYQSMMDLYKEKTDISWNDPASVMPEEGIVVKVKDNKGKIFEGAWVGILLSKTTNYNDMVNFDYPDGLPSFVWVEAKDIERLRSIGDIKMKERIILNWKPLK